MTAWRYRRCPSCLATFPAGELRPLPYAAGGLRRCPECRFVAFAQAFVVVTDRRQAFTWAMLN